MSNDDNINSDAGAKVLPFVLHKRVSRGERIAKRLEYPAQVILGACIGFLASRRTPQEILAIVEHSLRAARVALGKE